MSLDLGPALPGHPLHSLRGPPAPGPLRAPAPLAPCVQAPYVPGLAYQDGEKVNGHYQEDQTYHRHLETGPCNTNQRLEDRLGMHKHRDDEKESEKSDDETHVYLLFADIISLTVRSYTREQEYGLVLAPLT